MIERDRIQSPSVLLVSDLDDSGFDTSALTQELIRYERSGIDFRVVPLFPEPADRALVARLVGEDPFLPRRELFRNTELRERQRLVGDFPLAFVLAAAALLGLLALNERLCARIVWSQEGAGGGDAAFGASRPRSIPERSDSPAVSRPPRRSTELETG